MTATSKAPETIRVRLSREELKIIRATLTDTAAWWRNHATDWQTYPSTRYRANAALGIAAQLEAVRDRVAATLTLGANR